MVKDWGAFLAAGLSLTITLVITLFFNPALVAGAILAISGIEPAGVTCLVLGLVAHAVLLKLTLFSEV